MDSNLIAIYTKHGDDEYHIFLTILSMEAVRVEKIQITRHRNKDQISQVLGWGFCQKSLFGLLD